MRGVPADGWAEEHAMTSGYLTQAVRYLAKVAAIAEMDMRKLRHDPTELATRAIQPMLWLLVFGQVFAQSHTIPTGGMDYMAFLAPGILAQSVLFVAIFNGISVIWERDLGIIHKFLVSPAPRTALVLGKALAAALGVKLAWSVPALLGVAALVLLGAGLFSTFSLIIACIVKTRERFMGIGQVLTMPLFFASNAIYPTSIMPGWLRMVAHANPLSYLVDGLRSIMVVGSASTLGLGVDFGVLAAGLAVLILIGGRMYPRLIV
jgi:ABC-2 type transport system permease protein